MPSVFHQTRTTHHHNRFTAPSPGPPGWAGVRREPMDFMVQGKINRGRHTDHPAGRHSIQTNQCPPPPSPIFYRPDALPATQPTVSKHWRQLHQTSSLSKILTLALDPVRFHRTSQIHPCWQWQDVVHQEKMLRQRLAADNKKRTWLILQNIAHDIKPT